MQQVNSSMTGVVRGMDRALDQMNVEQISEVMTQFEQVFEDMDVRSGYMEDTMNSTTATITPQEEVNDLVSMIADENGLEIGEMMDELGNNVGRRIELKEGEEEDVKTGCGALFPFLFLECLFVYAETIWSRGWLL